MHNTAVLVKYGCQASRGPRRGLTLLVTVCVAMFGTGGTADAPFEPEGWFEAGRPGTIAAETTFGNPHGRVGILLADGPVDMEHHPFFAPTGTNGRACVTCHQPAGGMSVSTDMLRARWRATAGKDPVFAAIDGSNNPSLPPGDERSHSLLLNRGLFRVGLPWPPRPVAGEAVMPEFTIEVVSDPTGVNLDPVWGIGSATPTISVFRRPRPAANLRYVMSPDGVINIKLGELMGVDPETGKPVGMNMMADARHLTLKQQAVDAYEQHQQGVRGLTPAELDAILRFETQLYMAQEVDRYGLPLAEPGGPAGLGARAMLEGRESVLANNSRDPVFRLFEAWRGGGPVRAGISDEVRAFRASVARGNDIFMFRQFWIRDVTHINTVGLGNPIRRSCSTCHNSQMTGLDLAPGWVDLGTTNYPTWTEPQVASDRAELPVFKVNCSTSAPPHPFLGRTIYTTDPGRALITGRCADVGSITMQQFRGLAARKPYFVNGSARTLRELVDYYDRRFDITLTEQDKVDLVNFLSVL
jgi:hypothetical protein